MKISLLLFYRTRFALFRWISTFHDYLINLSLSCKSWKDLYFYSVELVSCYLGGYPQLLCLGHQWDHSWSFQVPTCAFMYKTSQYIARLHHQYHSCLCSALATRSRCSAMKNMLGSLAQRSTIFPFVILSFRRYLQSPIVQPQTVFIS